jgi:hypothetical protein
MTRAFWGCSSEVKSMKMMNIWALSILVRLQLPPRDYEIVQNNAFIHPGGSRKVYEAKKP